MSQCFINALPFQPDLQVLVSGGLNGWAQVSDETPFRTPTSTSQFYHLRIGIGICLIDIRLRPLERSLSFPRWFRVAKHTQE